MSTLIISIVLIILCCISLVLIFKFNKMEKFVELLKKVCSKFAYFWKEVIKFPGYILTHPIKGFTEFKNEKRGKMWVSITILILFVLEQIVEYKYVGPAFNKNDQTKFSSIRILVYSVVPVILIAVANWTVTTLMNGKGKMKEIFMMICYSLLPFVITRFIYVLLSNFLTVDEAQFLTLVNIIAIFLLCYMAFMGFVVIHEYGVFKTIGAIFLTALALCIIVFIALLIFDLSQQIYGFIYSIYKEIATRFV
ncbi:MAG: Yip1 family protein [Bacilli bacterium]